MIALLLRHVSSMAFWNMSEKLYTAKDVERCYPWITAGITNHRVTIGAIPLTHKSTGTGIPNMFTLYELVHCAVIDELATLGVFGKLHSASVNYRDVVRDKGGKEIENAWGSPNPYHVELDFYQRWAFRVIVEIQIHHKDLPGTNVHDVKWCEPTEDVPFVHIEPIPKGWGRYYYVLYAPEYIMEGKPFIQSELDYWLSPKKANVTRTQISKAFIHVRRLYELAATELGLRKA
jgi:hypothetical protein